MQQNISIYCPVGADEEYLNYELSTAICSLMTDVSKKVEVIAK